MSNLNTFHLHIAEPAPLLCNGMWLRPRFFPLQGVNQPAQPQSILEVEVSLEMVKQLSFSRRIHSKLFSVSEHGSVESQWCVVSEVVLSFFFIESKTGEH